MDTAAQALGYSVMIITGIGFLLVINMLLWEYIRRRVDERRALKVHDICRDRSESEMSHSYVGEDMAILYISKHRAIWIEGPEGAAHA